MVDAGISIDRGAAGKGKGSQTKQAEQANHRANHALTGNRKVDGSYRLLYPARRDFYRTEVTCPQHA
jgi:hypothetical protein